ncbi:MAG TPA: bifunctional 4-hydroxy-2-oxoglutarate aldolase/2-dehydro-3-deoxy-phosphogluconate aldolase [Streptosporangiaceae bacterium]|nr:bifunctional 4-hydroxy-2-oxoglutarate aldolase/2-dehydro-3-deoxy-phosphogluconate aldolase [Streptosporangiaceae bacterium]
MSEPGPGATGTAEERIREARVIAILRLDSPAGIVDICRTLVGAGLAAVEITMDHPHAIDSIRNVRSALGDRVLLGAGTVLDESTVAAAASAGAEFCVAPNLDPDVVAACRHSGVLPIPGVFSPTEIASASRLGLRLLKLFPCGGLTPDFLRALRGPFPAVGFVPTGGVDLPSVASWLSAGAAAVGLGSALVRSGDSGEDLARRVRRLAQGVQEPDHGAALLAGSGPGAGAGHLPGAESATGEL